MPPPKPLLRFKTPKRLYGPKSTAGTVGAKASNKRPSRPGAPSISHAAAMHIPSGRLSLTRRTTQPRGQRRVSNRVCMLARLAAASAIGAARGLLNETLLPLILRFLFSSKPYHCSKLELLFGTRIAIGMLAICAIQVWRDGSDGTADGIDNVNAFSDTVAIAITFVLCSERMLGSAWLKIRLRLWGTLAGCAAGTGIAFALLRARSLAGAQASLMTLLPLWTVACRMLQEKAGQLAYVFSVAGFTAPLVLLGPWQWEDALEGSSFVLLALKRSLAISIGLMIAFGCSLIFPIYAAELLPAAVGKALDSLKDLLCASLGRAGGPAHCGCSGGGGGGGAGDGNGKGSGGGMGTGCGSGAGSRCDVGIGADETESRCAQLRASAVSLAAEVQKPSSLVSVAAFERYTFPPHRPPLTRFKASARALVVLYHAVVTVLETCMQTEARLLRSRAVVALSRNFATALVHVSALVVGALTRRPASASMSNRRWGNCLRNGVSWCTGSLLRACCMCVGCRSESSAYGKRSATIIEDDFALDSGRGRSKHGGSQTGLVFADADPGECVDGAVCQRVALALAEAAVGVLALDSWALDEFELLAREDKVGAGKRGGRGLLLTVVHASEAAANRETAAAAAAAATSAAAALPAVEEEVQKATASDGPRQTSEFWDECCTAIAEEGRATRTDDDGLNDRTGDPLLAIKEALPATDDVLEGLGLARSLGHVVEALRELSMAALPPREAEQLEALTDAAFAALINQRSSDRAYDAIDVACDSPEWKPLRVDSPSLGWSTHTNSFYCPSPCHPSESRSCAAGALSPYRGHGSVRPCDGGSVRPSDGGSFRPCDGGSFRPCDGGSFSPCDGGGATGRGVRGLSFQSTLNGVPMVRRNLTNSTMQSSQRTTRDEPLVDAAFPFGFTHD